jgi:A-factor biosynthesis hotdog domain
MVVSAPGKRTPFQYPETGRLSQLLVRDLEQVTIWSATLALDLDDPYLFDHPLDHLPGMALVAGLLDLLRISGTDHPERSGLQMSLSLDLSSFGELGPSVQLEAVIGPHSGMFAEYGESEIVLRARQADRVLCEGTVAFRPAALHIPPRAGAHTCVTEQVDQAMVHRRRAENVLISGVVAGEGTRMAEVRRPPEGHLLAASRGRPLRAEAVIDAARQFATLLNHVEHGAPSNTQFVLLGIQADLPCGPRSCLQLRWTCTPPTRGRSRMVIDLVAGDPDGKPCGSVTFDYFAATPAVYRRLRGTGGSS